MSQRLQSGPELQNGLYYKLFKEGIIYKELVKY